MSDTQQARQAQFERTVNAANRAVRERIRQVTEHGFSTHHDMTYRHNELGRAAAWYAWNANQYHQGAPVPVSDPSHPLHSVFEVNWPFCMSWWKPKNKIRDLERAAAMLIAALEVAIAEEERKADADKPSG